MKRQIPSLSYIDHNVPITYQTHSTFLYHLQHAMLLALREQGMLNPIQYHYAEETLKQQFPSQSEIQRQL